ncbi:hypothetical protein Mp_2g24320 [Marchantia polymorpha subsp. ruderalis]|uniref:Uncharacterized protein n=1 Tax=Marchantia polymorpha TaxID=3197 RepID=A0A2R6WPH5_MARPO|nr:hypothetical protein MARPO_0069s0081 [Marchantia polymorpha]BBN03540.1 hypothetical protein Mp_2g24320 [Marchantia polymorpha subsp. ruderalis]|eukprot:PTQ35746.1 hypothetical protein MARPO_0069s0081 [Marchantia polymorpha]
MTEGRALVQLPARPPASLPAQRAGGETRKTSERREEDGRAAESRSGEGEREGAGGGGGGESQQRVEISVTASWSKERERERERERGQDRDQRVLIQFCYFGVFYWSRFSLRLSSIVAEGRVLWERERKSVVGRGALEGRPRGRGDQRERGGTVGERAAAGARSHRREFLQLERRERERERAREGGERKLCCLGREEAAGVDCREREGGKERGWGKEVGRVVGEKRARRRRGGRAAGRQGRSLLVVKSFGTGL